MNKKLWKVELNHWDGNYFGKAVKQGREGIWMIWTFDAYDESYNRVDEIKNIDEYIKENKLVITEYFE